MPKSLNHTRLPDNIYNFFLLLLLPKPSLAEGTAPAEFSFSLNSSTVPQVGSGRHRGRATAHLG